MIGIHATEGGRNIRGVDNPRDEKRRKVENEIGDIRRAVTAKYQTGSIGKW